MGLIKAALGAVNSTLADQWKEYFYCDALASDVLVVKGQKKVSKRSSNTKGNDNIITDGSIVAVANGQCMIIVENGKVVEMCAEPGEFTYDSGSEPSIFVGKLSDSVRATFDKIGKRFVFGGDAAKDQRVYYINTKEIMDNRFGTINPVPFRVVDRNIGLDVDVSLRCNGAYSFKIADPILFYTNVCGNVSREYTKDEIENQLKMEFVSALQPALAKISSMQIRPSEIVAHNEELCEAMNDALSNKWGKTRGLDVVSVALNSVTLPDEDAKMIKNAQKAAVMRDPSMYAATLGDAQADAMRDAAKNPNGAMMGFMGLNQAMGANSNINVSEMLKKDDKKNDGGWVCECGQTNSGKFCSNCGKPRPSVKYCPNCGAKVTEGAKFCSDCGQKL